jgi:hypothetical protein
VIDRNIENTQKGVTVTSSNLAPEGTSVEYGVDCALFGMVARFSRLWLAGYILTAPVLATDEMEHFADSLLLAQ